jgi:hypothetical protein
MEIEVREKPQAQQSVLGCALAGRCVQALQGSLVITGQFERRVLVCLAEHAWCWLTQRLSAMHCCWWCITGCQAGGLAMQLLSAGNAVLTGLGLPPYAI